MSVRINDRTEDARRRLLYCGNPSPGTPLVAKHQLGVSESAAIETITSTFDFELILFENFIENLR